MSTKAPALPPEPKFVLRNGMGPVSCLDFGPNDSLYVGTEDGQIHIWDLTINRQKSSFKAGNSVCLAVKIIADRIITQIKGESVSVWSLTGEVKLLHYFKNPYVGFCKIEVPYTETCHAFIPTDDSRLLVFNLDRYDVSFSLTFGSLKVGEVMVMKYIQHTSRDHLIAGFESGDIYLYDVMKEIRVCEFKIDNVPMAIDFDSSSGKGVCGTESNVVLLFQLDSDSNISLKSSLKLTNPGVSSALIRPDKKVLVLGCWDGNLRVYSWKSDRMLAVLSEHTESINDLCYSPKPLSLWGSLVLAAASKDKSVSLWTFY